MIRMRHTFSTAVLMAACLLLVPHAAADQVILDDLIVDGSACVGQDCVNGESFGFDTLRLKENNLRIKFQDTSNSASFPTNDWQLTANDSTNGGAEKFSIDDISNGRTPFTIEASAPSHSLYVDDGGRVGLGTSTPVVELHVVDGDTPTLRLEQDGSSGFTPQTWDVAGNETNFFVRDATNGSRLPLRIRPSAPSNSLFVDTDGAVGMNTSSPSASLHIVRSDGNAKLIVEENGGGAADRMMLELLNHDGASTIIMNNESVTPIWEFIGSNAFQINNTQNAGIELSISPTGNLTILGQCGDEGNPPSAGNVCDYVFDPGYKLESIEEHAESMWENSYLPAVGPTPEGKQIPFNITQRSFGMLNELEKAHIYIDQLNERLNQKESQLEELTDRLARLEAVLGAQ